MRIRYIMTVSVGFKVGLFILCYSLFLINKTFGSEGYFNSILTDDQQVSAVHNAHDVNARNTNQMTGLMFAGAEGELALARALFEAGANLNLVDPTNKNTAFHYAVNNNPSSKSQAVAGYLADVFANADLKNNTGATPLHLAMSIQVLADRLKMITKLVKNGANINEQNNDGDTIMHMMVRLRDGYAVTAVLNEWGSILDLNIKNKKGYTPHGLAEYLNYFDLAQKFDVITRITTPTTYDSHGLNGLMLAIIRNDTVNLKNMVSNRAVVNSVSRDEYGNTPLHIALTCENIPAIQLLIDSGADLNAKNKFGETPVHYIVRLSNADTRMKIAKKIIGTNPSFIDMATNNGNTLLHYLVQYNDPKLMAYILTTYGSKISIKAKNKKFQTPYTMAVSMKRGALADLLLAAQNKYLS